MSQLLRLMSSILPWSQTDRRITQSSRSQTGPTYLTFTESQEQPPQNSILSDVNVSSTSNPLGTSINQVQLSKLL